MKLDRHINQDGTGKYALIKMRKLDQGDRDNILSRAGKHDCFIEVPAAAVAPGTDPGGQFFVFKYSDKFAHIALLAYAHAVENEALSILHATSLDPKKSTREAQSLMEYAAEVAAEAEIARAIGCKVPKPLVRVWRVTQDDWYAGESLDSIMGLIQQEDPQMAQQVKDYGPRELSEEEMRRLMYEDESQDIRRTFKEQLDYEIASGCSFPHLFASTEI